MTLRNLHRGKHLTVTLQPIDVPLIRMLLYLTKKLNRFGFQTGFIRIIKGNHHFNLHGNDVAVALNQTGSLYSFSWDLHCHSSSKKWTVTNFATPL